MTNQLLFVVTASVVADLSPVLHVQPSIATGITDITLGVDVVELNEVPSRGLITIKITKEALINLSFSSSATSIGTSAVQNSPWT